ncbi:Uridylate kinase [Candidatus Ecksteinia adelgidicola]|nr:Uridylate kinase [Candidatus Ecksteinia adelgidicola]
MSTNKNSIYRRILLKFSGEALQGKEGFGISDNALNYIVQELKKLVDLNIQVGIVIGGGNFFRGTCLTKIGINHLVADHMGILGTIINGLAMCDALRRNSINSCLMSAIPLNGICKNYNLEEAISLLESNFVVIFSAGIGNPCFTTDSAACLRGIEIKAEVVLKATKVDGIYSADPLKESNALLYNKLTYKDVLNRELKIMDLSAFTLARDYHLPIRVFNINKPNALYNIIMGQNEGTLICE